MRQKETAESLAYSHVLLRPEEQIGQHSQDTWELSYIIRGSGTRTLGCSREAFCEGEVVLVAPGMLHQWLFDSRDVDECGNIENITVTFSPYWLHALAAVTPEYKPVVDWLDGLNGSIRLYKGHSTAIRALLVQMEHERPCERVVSLMRSLAVVYGNQQYAITVNDANADNVEERVKKIDVFLVCNYRRDLCLDDVASHVGMSRSALCSFYRQRMGSTIFSRIVALRLAAAKHLLECSGMSIAQCCYNSGFNDIPYFNRVFKKTVGLSPKEYRAAVSDGKPGLQ